MYADLILLIQANDDLANLWLRTIAENNITQHTACAKTGDEATAFLFGDENVIPCLIMIDMEMRPGEAAAVIRRIKADPVRMIIPVIALISDGAKRYVDEALTLGADGYIVSAVDYAEYLQEIEKLQFYWNKRSELTPAAKASPYAPEPTAGDLRVEKIRTDFVMLIQAEDAGAKQHARTIQEQIILGRIRQFNSGAAALTYFFSTLSWLPRFILLDMALPADDVAKFMAKMKNDPEKKHVPVIALVADETNKSVTDAYNTGANSYLLKPKDYVEHRVHMEKISFFWNNPGQLPR